MSSKKDTPLTLAYDSSSKKQEDGMMRETGIDIIGVVPWGTHLCQFYKTKDDLIDILVPYFKAGLQNNEFCMWITSEPLHVDEAKRALQKAVKNLDDYMKKGQVEILDATQWYTKSGKFDADEVLAGWVKKEAWARKNGFDGLRLTGNTFWLEKKDWEDFTKYEELINHVIGNYKMIAICSYSLDKCNASEIIDVVSNHQFALIQRDGKWHRIESPEMKKNEQKRERQVQLLNQVQDGIIASDPEFRITFWNKGAEQIFGYSEVEALGKTTTELLQPIYAPGEREKIIGELNHLGTSKVKIHVKHRNGIMIITEVHATRINNGFGDITGYVISYRDVTDYEMAQTALGEAELKYRTVADNTYDFEFWIDPNGKFLYASPSCKRITGYKTEDFLKDPTLRKKIVHPDDQAIFDRHIHEEKKYIAGEAEYRIVHKNGSIQWISHVCQPIYDRKGRYLGLRGSNRRTTEGKLIEGALRESEERLRLAQNSANVGIWDWNIQTNDLFFTPELNQLYGLAPDSIKTYQDWRNLTHLDDIERIETERDIAITNHQPFNLEFRILHRSGEIRWINAKGGAFYEKDSKAVRVLGVNIDITERKKAEEELRETRDYLENLLNYANAPIIVWDSESRIIKFNHAFEHLTGYTSNNVIGKKLHMLFPDLTREESLKSGNNI
jgi:PAS domain S-box-containing protein